MGLQLLDVHHRYGRHDALRGVTLHVATGDCYGFIGHNGAGKTTALRIALGLQRPSAGRVRVDGFDAAAHPVEARARMGGLIEQPGFHAGLSAAANLALLARAAGMARAAARREAGRVLERVGLGADAGRRAGGFSQGMRQRLGVAQALLGAPRILLFDEPTNGLDPEGIRAARRLFASLVRDDGVTLVLSSHQLHELEGLCNRVGVLRRGELVVEDTLERLFRSATPAYRLRVGGDLGPAHLALGRLGLTPLPADGLARDELAVDLGGRRPADVQRALLDAGVDLTAFAPQQANLEEIVLAARAAPAGATRSAGAGGREPGGTRVGAADGADPGRSAGSDGDGRAAPAGSGAREPAAAEPRPATGAPRERIGPRAGVWRAARYEARRLARWPVLALLAAPAAAALLAELARGRVAARERELVEAGELFGATAVTGFEAVGHGLRAGVPLLALVAAGIASQSLAGELARGTLRNLLLRPFRRASVAAGKALALLGATALGYAAVAAASLAGAALLFDFGDVVEILPNGVEYVHLSAADVRPELFAVLPQSLAPLLACAALGFLAGALARTGAGALAAGLGALAATDLLRAIARPLGWEGRLLTSALPSPLSDRSAVAAYLDFCSGVSNVSPPAAEHPLALATAWLVPCLLLAAWRLARRPIP
jgi:ABC-2 type transport system ATP-binding protein